MTIFDRLLAGERVTVYTSSITFDATYKDGRLVSFRDGRVFKSPPMSVDALEKHIEENMKRYGWRDTEVEVKAPFVRHSELVPVIPAPAPEPELEPAPEPVISSVPAPEPELESKSEPVTVTEVSKSSKKQRKSSSKKSRP